LKNRLNTKIVFTVVFTSLLVYALVLGIIIFNFSSLTQKNSEEMLNALVHEKANEIRAQFEGHLGVIRALASVNENSKFLQLSQFELLRDKLFEKDLKKNPLFLALWDSREMSFFDTNRYDKSGRVSTFFIKKDKKILKVVDTADVGKISKITEYHRIKEVKNESLSEPYWTKIGNKDSIFETTLATPIFWSGEFAGVVGIDFSLHALQEITGQITPFENSIAFLLTNNGNFVTVNFPSLFGKKFDKLFLEKQDLYVEKIKKGEFFNFHAVLINKVEYFLTVAPFKIGTYEKNWSLGIAVPVSEIQKASRERFVHLILFSSLGFGILVLVLLFLLYSISRPVLEVTEILKKLEVGEISDIELLKVNANDELGEMAQSTNNLITGLNNLANFATEVRKGNYAAQYNKLGKNDKLGSLLVELRDSLTKAEAENQKSKHSAERRNWITAGLAVFAELLRSDSTHVADFAYKIISELTKYVKANQGAILMLNDEDKTDLYLELLATYAFERRKYSEKKIDIGENLVGQSVLEKEIIYLTDLPEDYTVITSGLGKSTPRNIIIVPLIFNEQVQGVIELASFNIFDKYEKQFIEKVSEAIAATFATIKINSRTARLLEDSKIQAEQMKAQEEEMRQSMEQIRAQQEEIEREIRQYKRTIAELNKQLENCF